jgi:hypothetical protein
MPCYERRMAITVWASGISSLRPPMIHTLNPTTLELKNTTISLQKETNRIHVSDSITSEYSKDTIFVSIASYRDAECKKTLFDLFYKADHPFRIFVGLVLQIYPTDDMNGQYGIPHYAVNGLPTIDIVPGMLD